MRIPSGKTDQKIYFIAVDSVDLRTKKTGLSSFTVYRSRNGGAATLMSVPAVTEVSSANMPGLYYFTVNEDTTIASTSDSEEMAFTITQASMAPVYRTIELYRRDTTSGNTAAIDSNGRVDVIKVNGTSQTARDIGASVLLSAGTGTGQLDFTSGVVKANLVQILGTALTETAGQIAAGFKKLFDVASPVFTLVSVNQTGDSYARLGAPAGASISADIAAVKTDTAAVKTQTDKMAFTVTNQIDANVLDWKSATAPAMTGDAFARLGAPAGASVSADIAAAKTDTAAIKAKTDNLPASPAAVSDIPTANTNADALLDRADAVETAWTLRKALRVILAYAGGKTSGMGSNAPVFRDITDSKDRITATLDSNNNRTAVTADGT